MSLWFRSAGSPSGRAPSVGRHPHRVLAPDGDHRGDPVLQVAQGVDDPGGALRGQVLEGAGRVDRGRVAVEGVAGLRVGPALAQGPGRLLDRFGGAEDVGGRLLGLAHDGVEGEDACVSRVSSPFGALSAAISPLVRLIASAMSRRLPRRCPKASCPRSAVTLRSSRAIAPSSTSVSAPRLRRAYSARNQRPRSLALIVASIASYSADACALRVDGTEHGPLWTLDAGAAAARPGAHRSPGI